MNRPIGSFPDLPIHPRYCAIKCYNVFDFRSKTVSEDENTTSKDMMLADKLVHVSNNILKLLSLFYHVITLRTIIVYTIPIKFVAFK